MLSSEQPQSSECSAGDWTAGLLMTGALGCGGGELSCVLEVALPRRPDSREYWQDNNCSLSSEPAEDKKKPRRDKSACWPLFPN